MRFFICESTRDDLTGLIKTKILHSSPSVLYFLQCGATDKKAAFFALNLCKQRMKDLIFVLYYLSTVPLLNILFISFIGNKTIPFVICQHSIHHCFSLNFLLFIFIQLLGGDGVFLILQFGGVFLFNQQHGWFIGLAFSSFQAAFGPGHHVFGGSVGFFVWLQHVSFLITQYMCCLHAVRRIRILLRQKAMFWQRDTLCSNLEFIHKPADLAGQLATGYGHNGHFKIHSYFNCPSWLFPE